MANSTVDAATIVGAYGYAIQGFLFGFCNLLIGLSVLKYSALKQHNQYVLLMGLAFADAGNMFGYCMAGLYRLWLVQTDQLATLLTPLECLSKPHAICWFIFEPFSSLMLPILSLDRLFMVCFPSIYVLSVPSPKYANLLVLGAFVISCISAVIGIVGVLEMPETEAQSAICFVPFSSKNQTALHDIFAYCFQRTSYLAVLSVLLFAAVPLLKKLCTNNLTAAERESQNRMTTTVAVSCLCTLCLFCIPQRLAYETWEAGHKMVARVFFLLGMTNPAANIVIYELRHYEMKLALKSLFTWKQMPENLTVWPKPNNQNLVSGTVGRVRAFQMAPRAVPNVNSRRNVEQLQVHEL